jgi:integrase
MRLYKRQSTWWVDFSVNGQRHRVSLETTDRRKAVSTANDKLTQAKTGKLSTKSQGFARLAFIEAAERYLAGRKTEIADSSHIKETQLLVRPQEYFGVSRVNRIGADQILAYREWRADQGVGPAIINMEVGVLRRILKRAKLWHTVADEIRPLKEPRTIGRALSPTEKSQLLETASGKPEWETAYYAAILALNTTMRGCEIKGLRWSDVELFNDTLTIRKSKTEAGERVIPLTPDASEVLVGLRTRAEMFGTVDPSHFVFATCTPNDGETEDRAKSWKFNPTVPIRTWRTAWRKLTRAIKCPTCFSQQDPAPFCRKCKADIRGVRSPLHGLRFHDLRHHAITELAESGASEQTIKAIAGHVSQRMLDRYSHIRLEAKRAALRGLSESGYGTNHGTKGEPQPLTISATN